MTTITIWRAYRAARARASWNVHDREALRQQRVFESRLITILTELDEKRATTITTISDNVQWRP